MHNFVTTRLLKAKYKGLKRYTDENGIENTDGTWNWYDVKSPPGHVMLCQRMRDRDPGSTPSINTRIPFIYIVKEHDKGALVGELIEHPTYIKKHNLRIDYLYYITNQIQNPSVQFFELITPDITEIFDEIINKGGTINSSYLHTQGVTNTIESFKKNGMIDDNNNDNNVDDYFDKIPKFVSNSENGIKTEKKAKAKKTIKKSKQVCKRRIMTCKTFIK